MLSGLRKPSWTIASGQERAWYCDTKLAPAVSNPVYLLGGDPASPSPLQVIPPQLNTSSVSQPQLGLGALLALLYIKSLKHTQFYCGMLCYMFIFGSHLSVSVPTKSTSLALPLTLSAISPRLWLHAILSVLCRVFGFNPSVPVMLSFCISTKNISTQSSIRR